MKDMIFTDSQLILNRRIFTRIWNKNYFYLRMIYWEEWTSNKWSFGKKIPEISWIKINLKLLNNKCQSTQWFKLNDRSKNQIHAKFLGQLNSY